MWGYSLQLWQAVVVWATIVTAVAGGIAVASGFVAGWIGYRVSDIEKSEASKRIAEAGAEAQNAIANAAIANEAAARAHERAAALERDAEEARAEQERIRQQLAWRRINAAQGRQIAESLRAAGVRPSVVVTTNDPEAIQFREHVLAVLRLAGNENPGWVANVIAQPFRGLAARGPNEDDRRAIITAFTAAGFQTLDAGYNDTLEIVIGAKP